MINRGKLRLEKHFESADFCKAAYSPTYRPSFMNGTYGGKPYTTISTQFSAFINLNMSVGPLKPRVRSDILYAS